jgi:hypothetical protein
MLAYFLTTTEVSVDYLLVYVSVCSLTIWTNGLNFIKFNKGVCHNIQFILIGKNSRQNARIMEAEEIPQSIGYCISY